MGERVERPFPLLPLAFLLVFFSAGLNTLRAQSKPLPPLRDKQLWTDVLVYNALREKTDLFFDGGLRWGRDASRLVYERASVGVAFRLNKHLSLTPRYSFTNTEPTATQEVRENRLGVDATVSASARGWTITDRNVVERRFRKPADSTRYRNRLRTEWEFKPAGIRFFLFVSDEVYYHWAFMGWIRNRFQAGGGKILGPKLSLEVYYLRQKDYQNRPNDLHAFGLSFRTRF